MSKPEIVLTEMEGSLAAETLLLAVRETIKQHPFPSAGIGGHLSNWCAAVLASLRDHKAFLAYRSEIVAFPPPKRPHFPSYAVDVDKPPRVSTLELRRHAFAAFAAGMAHHGPDAAFEAAVQETLRRNPRWTLAVAVQHTKKFIVPAYEAAFRVTSG